MKKALLIVLLLCFISLSIYASSERKVYIIAHRGASGFAPENTLAAFKLAQAYGSDYIEFDVQMTKDGELVAIHDVTVERTTNGVGKVQNLTVKQLKKLDAGSWFNQTYPNYAKKEYVKAEILTVEEIFQRFGAVESFLIELKYPYLYTGIEEKLVRLLQKYNLIDKTIVISSNKESLKKLYRLNGDLKLGLLLYFQKEETLTEEELQNLQDYIDVIIPNYKMIDEAFIKTIKQYPFQIFAFTVNDGETMYRLIDWGIDGIITDFPNFKNLSEKF